MSSDFGTAGVTLETRMGTAKQDVESYAASVDKVGTSAAAASDKTDALERASRKLADARRAAAAADAKVAAMLDRTNAAWPRVLANAQDYNKALHEQMVARQGLARAIKDGQDAQEAADKSQARSTSAGGGGSPGVAEIATGVGIGVAAEHAAEAVVEKAKEFLFGSVEQASKLQETLSTNAEVFTGYASEIDKFGSTAARSLGLSKQAAIEAADSFGGVFHAVGVGDDKAVGLSKSLTQLGVDLAAFKHEADPGQALAALQRGLTGQFDALRNYDVVLTTATVRQEAFRLGLIHTRTDALTPQVTALAVASLAAEQAHTQTGAFARSTEELGGKQKVLKANIADAQAQLGKGLLPAMSGAADVADGTLVPALKAVGSTLSFIGENNTTRHLAEIALAMYGLSVAVTLTAGAYTRLAAAAATAAGAEGAAALGARGLLFAGLRTPVGALALGAILSAQSQYSSGKELARDAAGNREAVAAAKTVADMKAVIAKLEAKATKLREEHENASFVQVGKEFLGFARDPFEAEAAANAAVVEARRKLAQFQVDAAAERTRLRSGVPYVRAQVRVDRARDRQAAAAYNVRDARAFLDSRSFLKDVDNIPLRGLLDALPEKPDRSVVENARDALSSSKAAVAIAEARLKEARQTRGGGTAGQIASAEAAVLSARDATRKRGGNAEAEALRLQAAEERLAKVKKGGTTDTLALQTAEKSLADARRGSQRAAADLHKAEKEASGDKSISLKDVLARASHTAKTSTGEVANVRRLVKAGLSEPVIAELERLEQTAPGTIARVAKGITPAFVKQLNADQAARDQAAIDLARLGGQAKLKAAQAEAAASGKSLGDAVAAALVAALKDPAWQEKAIAAVGELYLPPGVSRPHDGAAPPGVAAGITVPPQVVPGPAAQPTPSQQAPGHQPVALHLTPIRSGQIRQIVAPDIARADRQASLGIGRQG